MAQNTPISQLDPPQMIKRAYVESNDSFRVELGSESGFDVAINDTTDSIAQRGISTATSAALTSASTGVVIAAFDCKGMKSFNLYTKTATTITNAKALTLEISPDDTADVWKATTLTITPDTTAGVVVMGTAATNIVARRARVSTTAVDAGTFSVYVVAQGN